MSARVGLDENGFLSHCASLLRRGIMRRFGAALNHRRAGFVANALTCWAAPADKLDSLGERLALQPQVSHCYQRKANPLWQYNLFAMIHGQTGEECREVAQSISSETGIKDYVLLFSTREIKKTRVKYLV
jgi:DNA-binding Lrp family transcriptional regulator